MQVKALNTGLCLAAFLALTACAPKTELRPSAISSGPDEFGVVPSKPLEAPTDFTLLPAPTPKGGNLADQQPKSDAIVALGGRPNVGGGVDGGIVSYASRFGVDPAIRTDLAQDDATKLKRSGWGSLPWKKDKYERTYKRFSLDAFAEWRRLRALGVNVPSAPPRS
ncbi:DUF3035 domain-containing protein [Celeribacter marinus]|uniref:DUF3035 domain-containing protein n=1 Tax=Celeribacter marinus TaxID=1397108 RepID=UPI003F6C11EE